MKLINSADNEGDEGAVEAADLVCAADEVEVVPVEELGDDVRAEGEAHPAVILPPALGRQC